MILEHRFPIVPSTTYFCDCFWSDNRKKTQSFLVASVNEPIEQSGIWTNSMEWEPTYATWHIGASISSTTYFCDAFWTDNTGVRIPLLVGSTPWYEASGIFCNWLCGTESYVYDNVGASIS